MAQADGVVANGTGSAVRSDINTQYAALWSNHSGSTEPSSGKVAYQTWADTNSGYLKIRNAANNAWIQLFKLDGTDICRLTGSTNNQITTVTGANSIQGEAKLTFDGDTLKFTHDAVTGFDSNSQDFLVIENGDSDTYINIATGATRDSGLLFSNGTRAEGYITYSHDTDDLCVSATDDIWFRTAGSERVRIDSSGRILAGTTSVGWAGADDLTVYNSGSAGITIRSGDDDLGTLAVADGTSGADGYRGWMQYDHNGNYLTVGTDGTQRFRVDSDGLKFQTDTAAANGLNDYETGTWSPTVFGSTTAGSYSYEAARTGGKYTKIGNLVYIEGVLRISSITSAGAGTLKFGGLPYAWGANPASSWNPGTGSQITHYAAGSNSTVSDYPPPFIAIGPASGTTFAVYSYGKNYAVDTDITELSATSWIYQIDGCYHV